MIFYTKSATLSIYLQKKYTKNINIQKMIPIFARLLRKIGNEKIQNLQQLAKNARFGKKNTRQKNAFKKHVRYKNTQNTKQISEKDAWGE